VVECRRQRRDFARGRCALLGGNRGIYEWWGLTWKRRCARTRQNEEGRKAQAGQKEEWEEGRKESSKKVQEKVTLGARLAKAWAAALLCGEQDERAYITISLHDLDGRRFQACEWWRISIEASPKSF
jgi:hypothetical protein